MLLDAGADVNAVSQLGRTPLIIAAAAHDSRDVVRLLLSKGANVNASDTTGVTALIAAANVDNLDVATMLLAHGADAHAKARTDEPSTALMNAAVNGNAMLVAALLARKPDLAVVSADTSLTGRRGPVMFGRLTALHAAITGRNPDVVEMLLKAGAPVDARDVRGMTPLMWAIGTDRPASRIVSLLLAHGADTALTSPDGESALDWARKFNNPTVLTHLKLLPAAASVPSLPSPFPGRPSAMEAVARSVPIQRAASATVTSAGCPACHAQPLTTMVIEAARSRWPSFPGDVEPAPAFLLNGGRTSDFAVRGRRRDAGLGPLDDHGDGRATDAVEPRDRCLRPLSCGEATHRRQLEGRWWHTSADAGWRLQPDSNGHSCADGVRHAGPHARVPGACRSRSRLALEADPADDGGPRDAAARTALGRRTLPSAPDARPGVARASAWGRRVVADAVSRQRRVRHGTGSLRASGTRRSCRRRRAAERRRLLDPDASGRRVVVCQEPGDEGSACTSRAGSRTATTSGSRTRELRGPPWVWRVPPSTSQPVQPSARASALSPLWADDLERFPHRRSAQASACAITGRGG